jgi:ABC-2 type transport system ATP-binding protein
LLDHIAILKGLRDGKRRKEIVHALLYRTNLYDARHRRLGTFSGGMKQRFGIAQALLGDPKLVIVDEPTAGLDPEERLRFLNLLADIGESIVIILSTHIVADVADLCRTVAIIDQGRVIEQGDPLQLTRALQGRLWMRYVTAEELAAYRKTHHVVSSRRAAGRLVIRAHHDGDPGPGFEASPPDLEDVYFLAIQRAANARAAALDASRAPSPAVPAAPA